ncbi:MAG: large subunit ribosomal protein L7/L12 [Candidatus Berkelbacteria bacterium Licking1014_2]|uniref:Large ribosomal subunit protein bL12 n=1 Tax=Candidatus Berkelbacteria bacterium Licking1014_2 TaxID=2017146 RepID=A0A554LW98_9BACT|nr:MAG: large subunit ribosomal protein L7/L12 [Candidatus Berkelbacteria bacterium Licking1014_2]
MSEEKTSKFADLIKQIEELSVKNLAELVKELEERFGVSAAAPPVGGGVAPADGVVGEEAGAAAEEKSEYTVVLSAAGDQKIAVIKAVREIRPDLGLKEAKDLVEAAPKTLKEKINKEEAETAKQKLTAAGATVELK